MGKPRLEQFALAGQVRGAKVVQVVAVIHQDNDRYMVSLWGIDGTRLAQSMSLGHTEILPILESLGWEVFSFVS